MEVQIGIQIGEWIKWGNVPKSDIQKSKERNRWKREMEMTNSYY